MKCVAYSLDRSQCINLRVRDSYHCELHRDNAKALYLKYKTLCTQCEKINIDNYQIKNDDINEQIDTIMNHYILYNKAFSAREKHRKYYMVSDYHDSGHNYQFTKLNKCILKCEEILTKLYSTIKIEEIEIVKDDAKEITNEQISKKLYVFTIEDFKQQRLKLEDEYQKCLSLYISENSAYVKEKELLIKNISVCLFRLFSEANKDTKVNYIFYKENGYYFTCIQSFKDLTLELIATLIFEMMMQLTKINYFEKTFIRTDVYLINLKIAKYTDCHLNNYLSQFTIVKLKDIYTKLLLNNASIENLIGPIMCDLICIFTGKQGYGSRLLYYLTSSKTTSFLLRGLNKEKLSRMKYKDFGDAKTTYIDELSEL